MNKFPSLSKYLKPIIFLKTKTNTYKNIYCIQLQQSNTPKHQFFFQNTPYHNFSLSRSINPKNSSFLRITPKLSNHIQPMKSSLFALGGVICAYVIYSIYVGVEGTAQKQITEIMDEHEKQIKRIHKQYQQEYRDKSCVICPDCGSYVYKCKSCDFP